jgi:hypothetical protein
MPKFPELKRLLEIMTKELPTERPDCEEVIRSKHLWSLSREEFNTRKEINIFLEECEKREKNFLNSLVSFLKVYLMVKMKDKNKDKFVKSGKSRITHFPEKYEENFVSDQNSKCLLTDDFTTNNEKL